VNSDPARFVGRQDPSVPAQVREDVFHAPRPEGGKPVYRVVPLSEGGAALVVITNVRTHGTAINTQANAAASEKQRSQQGEGEVAAYIAEVRRTTSVKKNPKAFE
jgi:hypothetical protein